MEDIIKNISIDNNFKKLKDENSLIECDIQLSDKKKKQNGFSLSDSVIDVVQGGYAISYGDDVLFTYGIEPCCGVVLYDEWKSILFHLDGRTSVEEIKKITDSFGFNNDAKVIICPGVTCGIPGSFNYEYLELLYRDCGYDTATFRINGTFGYISVTSSDIRFGSLLFKDSETVINKQQGLKF